MAERSKRIKLYDADKMEHINPETLKLFQKYQIDMSIRDLSVNSVNAYNADLRQWFIFMYDKQFNLSVLEATEDDITEYYFWRKQEGNNVNRMKRVMSSVSAFYKFLRKKRLIKESPTEFIDRPKAGQPIAVQTYLTKEQVQLMREKLEEYGDIQLQAYAFMSLTTMARVNAIAHLRWDQIDFDESFSEVALDSNNIDSTIATIKEQWNQINNKDFSLPVLEAGVKFDDNISILEDVDGYYARNNLTKKRTASVADIDSLTKDYIKSIY